ncbi:hypothetical protein EG878_17555, partial [Enterococcus faecalis]
MLALVRGVPVWAWALAACLAWGGFQRHRATSATKAAAVAEQRAAVEAATSEAERAARAQEQRYAESARKAADSYAAGIARARAAADATRRERDSLLDALAAAAPASGAASGAAATCRADDAPVVRSVLGECARALSSVAEAADADAAKLKGLQEYVQGVLPVAPVT